MATGKFGSRTGDEPQGVKEVRSAIVAGAAAAALVVFGAHGKLGLFGDGAESAPERPAATAVSAPAPRLHK